MARPEEKRCPRCGARFECRADTIELCHCRSVEFDDAAREALRAQYHDCLCPDCLACLAAHTRGSP